MFHSSPQAGAWNSPHTPRKQKNRTPKIGFEHDLSVESLQRMATLEVHVAAFGTTHSWKNWRRLKNWNWIASLLPRVAVRRNPAKSCCTTSTDNSSWSRGYCCKWRLQQMSFHFFVDRLTVPSKHHALFMVVCLTTEHFKSWYPWDDDPNCLTFWGGPNGHQLTICLNTYANNYPNPKHIQSWKKNWDFAHFLWWSTIPRSCPSKTSVSCARIGFPWPLGLTMGRSGPGTGFGFFHGKSWYHGSPHWDGYISLISNNRRWKHIWPVRTARRLLWWCYGRHVIWKFIFEPIEWWGEKWRYFVVKPPEPDFPGPKDDDFNEAASENWEQSKRHRDATRMAILHHWASKNIQQLFSERNILRDSIY